MSERRGRRTRKELAVYANTREYWRDTVDLGPYEVLCSLLNKGWLLTYSGMGHSFWRRYEDA